LNSLTHDLRIHDLRTHDLRFPAVDAEAAGRA
jgi:hypothetical protein